MRQLIEKKRDGEVLDASDIASFVAGVVDGSVSDAQIAAFAMATWFQGMTVEEEMNLTLAMRDSGTVLEWTGLDGPVLDKHSTGGVGDLVSLVLGPLAAACGAYVPMISGRGLGHTGGTLDKLESIPGFDCSLGIEAFQGLVRANGVAIIGQTKHLAPADRRVYAVRDITATVATRPLIISSILSKKLAEGLDGLVLDIKYGSGAFMADPAEATRLAGEISSVARRAGLPCVALVSDMGEPLCGSAGNALEVREAIAFLRNEGGRDRLRELVLSLCAEMLLLGGLAKNPGQARAKAQSALDSGLAAERFARMVAGQGGPADLLDRPEEFLPSAAVVRPVQARQPGFIHRVDMRAVGAAVADLGGGRQRAEDDIDPGVGLTGLAHPGLPVEKGTELARVHASSEVAWEVAASRVRDAIQIGPEPGASLPVVHGRVEGKAG